MWEIATLPSVYLIDRKYEKLHQLFKTLYIEKILGGNTDTLIDNRTIL